MITAFTARPAPPLTASDRCDRCIQQAVSRIPVKYVAESGDEVRSELLLCGHHHTKHAAAIAALVAKQATLSSVS